MIFKKWANILCTGNLALLAVSVSCERERSNFIEVKIFSHVGEQNLVAQLLQLPCLVMSAFWSGSLYLLLYQFCVTCYQELRALY